MWFIWQSTPKFNNHNFVYKLFFQAKAMFHKEVAVFIYSWKNCTGAIPRGTRQFVEKLIYTYLPFYHTEY